MQRIFPRALIACIAEDRPPRSQELAQLAEKVRREAFPGLREPTARHGAERVARAALGAPMLVEQREAA